ncbi:SDR family oxidoreductase [Agrobacterium rubi]|uniref:SDR family oxidoreductase n=1 Tax=Agrobacterium rubi TaxID=28099 RepID=A0AAE7R6Y4_9HYPH|nr:SDR family oxidoreductase [Agrobacterium rubi]NTE88424.1 SDR family oxidoreductase [Agrobacterium rubi]NTF04190.1 SDR family oxidoreductase [Agrobacterium rubi]NTF09603.1 SDR family oxidoreductase [Agrobacterium rubi]NTF22510.1 SDR family oxidoreductase [Agrobacterium rubi]NTF29367.1 SDR family oxidoreductase [Agrobacterium rubi]
MLEKPVIIITGCSSGIGAYCAQALHGEGWRVFATVRQAQDMLALQQQGIETLLMDYTKPDTVAALVDEVAARTSGRIDALFNNGAYGQPGAVEDISVDVLRQQFEANVFGWHDLTCRVIPFMRRRGQGRIVHCSSILGLVPYRYRGAYTASKFAIEGLGVTLRMELQGSGIHVSLIEPGPIASKFTATALAHIKDNIDLENSAHAQDYKRQLARLDDSGPKNKHKLGPDAVYAELKHALTAPRPKPHYLVTVPAKQAMILKRLLPAGLFYRLLRKFD